MTNIETTQQLLDRIRGGQDEARDELIARFLPDQIIFSRKPFDRVLIASTTKILTVLIACERSQLPPSDPMHVSFDDTYTVPAWVADDISGSVADLEEGEVVTLRDLVHMTLLISGNDAAHAIADMLHGADGPDVSIPLFLVEMNDRAIEIGMFDSHFNNPNGFEQEAVGPDFGDHYSTAFDMELLSRAAMSNPLFREISETVSYSCIRPKPEGVVNHNFESFQKWILENSWGMNGSGIKGGWTPAAQHTLCTSVEGVGRAIATTFGMPDGAPRGRHALELLTLGLGDCANWQLLEDWELEYLNVIDGIVARADERDLFSMWPGVPRNMQLDLFHATAEVEETDAFTQIHRETQIGILPNETIDFGIGPFDGAGTIHIRNMESRTIDVFVEVPEDGRYYHLPAGETVELFLPNLGELSSFRWTITSHASAGGGPAHLSVDETYFYVMDAPAIPTTEPIFSVELYRNERTENDLIGLDIHWWLDGGEYKLIVHDPEFPVSSIGGNIETTEAEVLQLTPPVPNPFSDATRIGFVLHRAAEVTVSIHDVSGRRIRHYPPTHRAAGFWSTTWDGAMDDGGDAAPGAYFYRVVVNGEETGGGKLVRLR
jgi:D-alanyl-D-alanine carboxypeptidase